MITFAVTRPSQFTSPYWRARQAILGAESQQLQATSGRQMHANPYQPPTSNSEPGAVPDITMSDIESDCVGIPYEGFLQYRRAAICLVLTMSLFFALISVDMFRHMSMVDGTISLTVPIVLLIVSAKVMSWRKVADTELTFKKYSDVSKNIRRHCLWTGPAVFAVGVAQMIWVPACWHIFVCPCLASGPLVFGCGFLWPRVEE